MQQPIPSFWSLEPSELMARLETSAQGLSDEQAGRRLKAYGPNALARGKKSPFSLLISQFNNPIILILLCICAVSLFLHDPADSAIIIVIVLASSLLGFWQEKDAGDIVARLLRMVHVRATMLRGGREVSVPIEQAAAGDVTLLSAGDSIPGDCLILGSEDLSVNEATFTGESMPVDKRPGVLPASTPVSKRTNSLFMGTHVVNGTARALVVNTGRRTELGRISGRISRAKPATDFEKGIARFGRFIMFLSLIMVGAIFLINILLRKPPADSLLFALALAVGLTPQLLPAIISVNLSRGATRLAENKVVVKRLASIENLGSMTVLCSDKTGTLTEGVMKFREALDPAGAPCDKVFLYGYLSAKLKSGFRNPIDKALRETSAPPDISGYRKLAERQYDFERKRMSMLVGHAGGTLLIVKGAFRSVLAACESVEGSDGNAEPLGPRRAGIERVFDGLGERGLRVLAVAWRKTDSSFILTKAAEKELTFAGFLVFADPLKQGIREVVGGLEQSGVTLKIITGDNAEVARHICREVFGRESDLLTADDLTVLDGREFSEALKNTTVFAEIDPLLKERIVRQYRESGEVVGFLGDGINDTPGLHASDVAITVNSAVDIAKEAADIVLLEKDLGVLTKGVYEGRRTFVNTLKYVFMATSANFGGTFSYLGTSLFLPFLPLLPKQVLLNNLLTDLPAMSLPGDSVDPGAVAAPRRWDIRFIRRFMVTFGLLSSAFDYLTFGALIFVFRADEAFFHTGWFVESVVTSVLIVFVIRTRGPFFRSRPGKLLLWASLADAVLVCAILPFTAAGRMMGFVPLPPRYFGVLAAITALFFVSAETTKRLFYGKFTRTRERM